MYEICSGYEEDGIFYSFNYEYPNYIAIVKSTKGEILMEKFHYHFEPLFGCWDKLDIQILEGAIDRMIKQIRSESSEN